MVPVVVILNGMELDVAFWWQLSFCKSNFNPVQLLTIGTSSLLIFCHKDLWGLSFVGQSQISICESKSDLYLWVKVRSLSVSRSQISIYESKSDLNLWVEVRSLFIIESKSDLYLWVEVRSLFMNRSQISICESKSDLYLWVEVRSLFVSRSQISVLVLPQLHYMIDHVIPLDCVWIIKIFYGLYSFFNDVDIKSGWMFFIFFIFLV